MDNHERINEPMKGRNALEKARGRRSAFRVYDLQAGLQARCNILFDLLKIFASYSNMSYICFFLPYFSMISSMSILGFNSISFLTFSK